MARTITLVAPGASKSSGPARPLTKKELEECWAGLVKRRDGDRELDIGMMNREIDDSRMEHWCTWFEEAHAKRPGCVVREANFSSNRLTAAGVRAMLNMFKRHKISVGVLKLFQNRIESGTDLAEWVGQCNGYLRELHLSHNRLQNNAAMDLIVATVTAVNTKKEFCYPRLGRMPLWLRLESNHEINHVALQASLKAALSKTLRPLPKAICYVTGKTYCNPKCCNECTEAPPVHLTYVPVPGFNIRGGATVGGSTGSTAPAAPAPPRAPAAPRIPGLPPQPAKAAPWANAANGKQREAGETSGKNWKPKAGTKPADAAVPDEQPPLPPPEDVSAPIALEGEEESLQEQPDLEVPGTPPLPPPAVPPPAVPPDLLQPPPPPPRRQPAAERGADEAAAGRADKVVESPEPGAMAWRTVSKSKASDAERKSIRPEDAVTELSYEVSAFQRYLEGRWEDKNRIRNDVFFYDIRYAGNRLWNATRSDGKVYPIRLNSEGTRLDWGQGYFLQLSQLVAHPDQASWHSNTGKAVLGKPPDAKFIWKRCGRVPIAPVPEGKPVNMAKATTVPSVVPCSTGKPTSSTRGDAIVAGFATATPNKVDPPAEGGKAKVLEQLPLEVEKDMVAMRRYTAGRAVLSVTDPKVRDMILEEVGKEVLVDGVPLQVKPAGGSNDNEEARTLLVATWNKKAHKSSPSEEDLLLFFSSKCRDGMERQSQEVSSGMRSTEVPSSPDGSGSAKQSASPASQSPLAAPAEAPETGTPDEDLSAALLGLPETSLEESSEGDEDQAKVALSDQAKVAFYSYEAETDGYMSVNKGDQVWVWDCPAQPGAEGNNWASYVYAQRELESGERESGWVPLEVLWDRYESNGRFWLWDPRVGTAVWEDAL